MLGSKTYRIDTTESALQLVRSIPDKLELTIEGRELVLQIQKEVVDEGKTIPQDLGKGGPKESIRRYD